MKELLLTRVHNPFDRNDRDIIHLEYRGESLEEIRQTLPAEIDFCISHNGRIVPYEHLVKVIPQPGDAIICVPVPAGGDDGKMIGRIIGMIIVAIVAIVAQQYYVLPALQGMMGVGAAATALSVAAAGAIMVVGGLLVNMAFSVPPKVPLLTGPDVSGSQSYGWAPQTTQQQGTTMPRLFGRNKVFGNIITSSIRNDGDQQYFNVLISLGRGRISGISQITLNDQPIGNYQSVTSNVRLGDLRQPVIPGFEDTRTDYPLSSLLSYGTPVLYDTVGDAFDRLEVEITCPQGLWYANNSGALDPVTVGVRVQIRNLTTGGPWINISETPVRWTTITDPRWSAGYWRGNKTVHKPTDSGGGIAPSEIPPIWIELEAGPVYFAYQLYEEMIPYHGLGEMYAGDPSGRATWQYFDGPRYVPDDSIDYTEITGAATSPLRFSFPGRQSANWGNQPVGHYQVKVERVTPQYNSSRYGDAVYLSKVTEITAAVFTYPRQPLVGLHALATGQLSNSLRFSGIADGELMRVYVGGVWRTQYSNNNAWVMWHILTQPVIDNDLQVVRYDGYQPAQMDLPLFQLLAARCDTQVSDGAGGTEPLHVFNGVFDSEMSAWSAALLVGEECNAVPYFNGFKVTLAIDMPAEPIASFGMGSIVEKSFEESWLPIADRATEIEVDFRDQDRDYERTTITFVNPDMIDAAPVKVPRQLRGITKKSYAWRYAIRKLKENELLRNTIKFSLDVDSMMLTLGSVFNFSHDFPQYGFSGRLVSATDTTLTLDRTVTIEEGKAYSVLVACANGSSATRTVLTGAGDREVLTVSAPFAPLVPAQYDQYFFGETGLLVKKYRVTKLAPTGDHQATIWAKEYLDLDSIVFGIPVLPPPDYSALETYVVVTNLAAADRAPVDESGVIRRTIEVSWSASGAAASGFEVYYRQSGTPWAMLPTTDTRLSIPGIGASSTYEIRVVGISYGGLRVPFDQAAAEIITTGSDLAAAGAYLKVGVSGLQIFGQGNDTEFVGRDCRFTWNKVSAVDQVLPAGTEPNGAGWTAPDPWFKDYEVKILNLDDSVRRIEHPTIELYTYNFEKNYADGNGVAVRDFRIEVRARDRYFRISERPARLTVSNPAPPAVQLALNAEFKAFSVNITPLSLPDIAGYVIHASQVADFVPAENTVVNRGPETFFRHGLPAAGTWYVKAAAADSFGEDALNYSAQYAVTVADAQILPDDLYTGLRTDFLVRDSIFSFGFAGNPGTKLSWTSGYITRGGTNYTLNSGNLASANNKYVIATLAAGVATLSLADVTAGVPALGANQIIVAVTSSTANSAGNYICYVREANSFQVEGATIRDATIAGAAIASAAIGTAHIADLAVTNAKIGNLAVDTLQIANNAVTVPVAAYTDGIARSSGMSIEVQQASITTSGEPVLIMVSFNYHPDAGTKFNVGINRGAAEIYRSPDINNPASNSDNFSCQLKDTPAAGTNTYTIYMYFDANWGSKVSQRSLVLLGVKK